MEIGYVIWCNRAPGYSHTASAPLFLILVSTTSTGSEEIPKGYIYGNLLDVFVCRNIHRLEKVVMVYMQTYGVENVIGGKYTYPHNVALEELHQQVEASMMRFRRGGKHHVLSCTVADRSNIIKITDAPNDNLATALHNDIVLLGDGPFDHTTVRMLHPLTQVILMTGEKMRRAMLITATMSGDFNQCVTSIVPSTSAVPIVPSTSAVPIVPSTSATTTRGNVTITSEYGDDINNLLDQISEASAAAMPIFAADQVVDVPLMSAANKPQVIRRAVWSADEDKTLKLLMDDGQPEDKIAEVMNREMFNVERKISTNVMRDKIAGVSADEIRTKYNLSVEQMAKYLPTSSIIH